MSLYTELIRLEARYAAARVSRDSCPRNLDILRTKIEGLQLELSTGSVPSVTHAESDPPVEDAEAVLSLETVQEREIRLWEENYWPNQ